MFLLILLFNFNMGCLECFKSYACVIITSMESVLKGNDDLKDISKPQLIFLVQLLTTFLYKWSYYLDTNDIYIIYII